MIIGLTGGFLTGKTTVAKFLKKKGIEVLEIDRLYETLLQENRLKKNLIKIFGKDILFRDKISKKKLRGKLLLRPYLLKELERVAHPLIIRELKRIIKSYRRKGKLLVIEVPLLYEKGLESLFDRVILISSSKKEQLKRAKKLGYTKKEVEIFINNQLPLRVKEEKADWVIRNKGTLKELKDKSNLLREELIKISTP